MITHKLFLKFGVTVQVVTGCLIKSGFTESVKGISAQLYRDFAGPHAEVGGVF